MKSEYKNLIQTGVYLKKSGYVKGSAGNLSLLLENGQIIASPTNSDLGALTEETLSLLTSEGILLEGQKPSKEVPFHLAIYQNCTAKAVIHLHSTYLTALSCLSDLNPENVLKPFTPYAVMKAGTVPLIPYIKPGSLKIAEYTRCLCKKHKAMLLANHGIIVTGSSIKEALSIFEELEETAKLFWILRNENIRYLTDDEINELT
ncbi:MAG: 3-oxo-tetronate 4-phosphate decarboxylase [Sphaerochaetaceae bacterium]